MGTTIQFMWIFFAPMFVVWGIYVLPGYVTKAVTAEDAEGRITIGSMFILFFCILSAITKMCEVLQKFWA